MVGVLLSVFFCSCDGDPRDLYVLTRSCPPRLSPGLAHRPADDGMQPRDAEPVEQHRLRAYHVPDGDDGKAHRIGLAAAGIVAGGAARSHATADDIGADDVIAIGIDQPARTDDLRPPARLSGHRMRRGRSEEPT